MRRAFAFVACCAASMCAAEPALEPDDAPLRALIDDGSGKPDALVGLQVALVREGRVVAERSYGRRYVHPSDRAQDLPLTVDSLLRVASMSKPVTAIAIMQLVERRKLDLDADISGYLGFRLRNPRFPAAPITLRQVLSHTASLADGDGYYMPLGRPLSDFFTTDAHFTAYAPGARFEYANIGSGVLATVLERATRQRFDRLVAKQVLARAGVEGTFDVASMSADQRARLAVTYRRGDEDAAAWDPNGPWLPQNDDWRGGVKFTATGAQPGIARYRPGANGTLFSPQGGLRTSAGQYARLMLCLLRDACAKGPLLAPASRAEMLRTQWRYAGGDDDTNHGQNLAWGLGLHVFPTLGRVGHLAEAYGLFGGALFTPDGMDGVVYLASGSAMPLVANRGKRSAFYAWEETIQDWAGVVAAVPATP